MIMQSLYCICFTLKLSLNQCSCWSIGVTCSRGFSWQMRRAVAFWTLQDVNSRCCKNWITVVQYGYYQRQLGPTAWWSHCWHITKFVVDIWAGENSHQSRLWQAASCQFVIHLRSRLWCHRLRIMWLVCLTLQHSHSGWLIIFRTLDSFGTFRGMGIILATMSTGTLVKHAVHPLLVCQSSCCLWKWWRIMML